MTTWYITYDSGRMETLKDYAQPSVKVYASKYGEITLKVLRQLTYIPISPKVATNVRSSNGLEFVSINGHWTEI